jgi:hypothetical protein
LANIPDRLNLTAMYGGITENFSEEIPAIPGVGANGFVIEI